MIYFQKTVLKKRARWLIKSRVSLTRWSHRSSTSCWRNDGAIKENLHFDNQIKVIETLEKAVETLTYGSYSHSISPSPKFPLVFL